MKNANLRRQGQREVYDPIYVMPTHALLRAHLAKALGVRPLQPVRVGWQRTQLNWLKP